MQQLVRAVHVDGRHEAAGPVGAGSCGHGGDGGRARLLGDGGGERRDLHHALCCDALRECGDAGPDQHWPLAAELGPWRLP